MRGVVFIAGPLEYFRPLLDPLFAWALQGGSCFAAPALPAMILLVLDLLAEKLQLENMSACREPSKDVGEVSRLDATADGNCVAIGGWLSRDGTSTKKARWFAC